MQIHLLNNSKQNLGGGWTFLRTFEKYLLRAGVITTEYLADADTIFISGATMADRALVHTLKAEGKKIIFRVDNVPRNSRNRNTGTSRLYDFAQVADLVVYQSQWAKDYLMPFLRVDGPVILNGADTEIFNPGGSKRPKEGNPQLLYTRFNRDETKNWHIAWYEYLKFQQEFPKAHLWLAGQFSPEITEYNFDFFMGERFGYLGVIQDPEDMAEIYRGTDILMIPYHNDACSQTLIEARNCGIPDFQFGPGKIGLSGGGYEIMMAKPEHLTADYMTRRYMSEIKRYV